MDRDSNILTVVGASKSLPDGRLLFEGLNMCLRPGESLSLVGKSGTGKSTLLAILGLLDVFDSGEHVFSGEPVQSLSQKRLDQTRGHEIGFVFQRFSLVSHLSVLENVMVPLRHGGAGSVQLMRRTALRMLELVEMDHMARKKPRELSGGEQQRVAIARALVMRPKLILADEPTGSLDEETGAKVMELLIELGSAEGAGLIVVTHDANVAASTNRQARMSNGNLIGGAAPSLASCNGGS